MSTQSSGFSEALTIWLIAAIGAETIKAALCKGDIFFKGPLMHLQHSLDSYLAS